MDTLKGKQIMVWTFMGNARMYEALRDYGDRISQIGLFSFNGSANTYMLQGFSTHWYKELFSNAAAMHALQNTVVLALCTAAVSTLLGVMAAVGIFNSRHKLYKRSLMLLTNVPMMNPEIVTGISMMLLFVFAGGLVHRSNVLGFWTLLIAHVTFSLPYVILNVIPKLHQFDMNIYEAGPASRPCPSTFSL